MSIYSGFATRLQEETYDSCINTLIFILQKRIMKFYEQAEVDEPKFIAAVIKVHAQLKNMENNKYLEPKSSHAATDLVKYLHANQTTILNTHTEKILPSIQPEAGQKSSMWVAK